MNKTVTINISGIIFHIEEDAYEKLSRYLSTIKGYFRDSDGRDEIMSDIEARIAEMLQEKVGKTKQVVLMSDVDEVISAMGQPEEFAAGSDETYSKEERATEEPKDTYMPPRRRRVFRDPDDRVLGGVCSGLGSYFDIDPVWIRIAFAVAFFVFGSGLLLYILLWIIIPQARTTAEKLEMRGESVNINNISKTVNEEMEYLRKRMENLGSRENRERMRHGASRLGGVLGDIFRVIGKVIAVFFVVLGIIMLVALLGSLFGANNVVHIENNGVHTAYSLKELGNVFFTSPSQYNMMLFGVTLLVGIPLIALVYLGIRLLFKVKSNRIVKMVLFGAWLVGWVFTIWAGIKIGKELDDSATSRQQVKLTQPKSDTLYLRMRADSRFDFEDNAYDSRVTLGDWNLVEVDDKKMVFGYPNLDIVKSETDSFELTVIKSANGPTKKDAQVYARNIRYNFYQTDSLVEFNPYFDIDLGDKFRNQSLRLVLKVPKGKVIFLSKSMNKIIYGIDNIMDVWDGDMVNRRWIMTPEGLDCIDCEGLEDRRVRVDINPHGIPMEEMGPPPPPVPATGMPNKRR